MPIYTITTTTADDVRVATSFGKLLGLGGPANATVIKQQLINYMINSVQSTENPAAAASAINGITPISPT